MFSPWTDWFGVYHDRLFRVNTEYSRLLLSGRCKQPVLHRKTSLLWDLTSHNGKLKTLPVRGPETLFPTVFIITIVRFFFSFSFLFFFPLPLLTTWNKSSAAPLMFQTVIAILPKVFRCSSSHIVCDSSKNAVSMLRVYLTRAVVETAAVLLW